MQQKIYKTWNSRRVILAGLGGIVKGVFLCASDKRAENGGAPPPSPAASAPVTKVILVEESFTRDRRDANGTGEYFVRRAKVTVSKDRNGGAECAPVREKEDSTIKLPLRILRAFVSERE